MDFENYLYERVLPIIQQWNDKDIYAISFFAYSNEEKRYNGYSNLSEFSISYNTEDGCGHASPLSEERWNLAFWMQDMIPIIDPDSSDEGTRVLFEWYKENNIENIGFEDIEADYDENMAYIGKGPVGYYELLCAVSNVARRLQTEGKIAEKFGRIPILVHALEESWFVEEATKNANPNGEADVFLKALSDGFSD